MATKLVQSPLAGCHVFPSLSISMEFFNSHKPSCSTSAKSRSINNTRLSKYDNQDWFFGTRSTFSAFSRKVVQKGNEEMGLQLEDDKSTVVQLKAQLFDCLEGINRGIFGMPSAKKTEIEELVKLIEFKNPTLEPTEQLEKVAGWNLEACLQHYHHPWIQTDKAWVA